MHHRLFTNFFKKRIHALNEWVSCRRQQRTFLFDALLAFTVEILQFSLVGFHRTFVPFVPPTPVLVAFVVEELVVTAFLPQSFILHVVAVVQVVVLEGLQVLLADKAVCGNFNVIYNYQNLVDYRF